VHVRSSISASHVWSWARTHFQLFFKYYNYNLNIYLFVS